MRCKVGDHCFIIRADSPEYWAIGHIVKIVAPDPFPTEEPSGDWEIVFLDEKINNMYPDDDGYWTALDSHLLPIRPLDEPPSITTYHTKELFV